LKTDISVVGYSADSESALYHKALILNQRVRYIADSESALYDTALIHEYSADSIYSIKNYGKFLKNIIIKFVLIICVKGHLNREKFFNIFTYLQIKFESALYSTALVHIQIRIYPRIRNRIRKYFTA
jgi:hypothetical protein